MSLYLTIGAAVLGAGALVGWVISKKKKPAAAAAGAPAPKANPFFSKIKKLHAEDVSKLEEVLLEGDLGAATTDYLLSQIKVASGESFEKTKESLGHEMVALLKTPDRSLDTLLEQNHPLVISIVGINGAGKTTTIGKLANYFKSSGKKVLLGAGDTFRAGAIAQLKTWADRVGVDFVTGREGADPGAVAFDSVAAGKARGMDVVLLDTAGRLHTKSNLMEELKKIHKVVKKVIPEAPHETWLVLDGTLGQNSLNQAKEFQQSLGLTGLVVTKLDGTAKGGAIFPVSRELSLPVRFVGVGEAVEDLIPFEPEKFVQAILG
ncbi:MAG: signal recognition particle-docking protein FtsY [Proteobacteria bacterium]|nr:signal recognition particle-docking protein FtsY [Pseudomonadota bacterium]